MGSGEGHCLVGGRGVCGGGKLGIEWLEGAWEVVKLGGALKEICGGGKGYGRVSEVC